MSTTESLRNVKDHLSDFVDRVEHQHERVVVTRNGRPAAVLMSPEDLEALEETLAVLSDKATMARLRTAESEVNSDDVVRGVQAVRSLRARR
jgi:prevent-host-death family protein